MVTNFRQERLVRERRRPLYGALFLITLIIVLGRGPIFSFMGRAAHFIGIPFWGAGRVVADGADFAAEYARPKSALASDVIELRSKLGMREGIEATADALRAENKELKELLGRKMKGTHVLARVVSRPPLQVYDTLLIDVGSNEGVIQGAVVFANGEYAIGTVTRVYDSSSVVTLSSAPGETRTASVAELIPAEHASSTSSEKHELIFTGIGGGGFHAQVPKHLVISTGTPMVLPSFNTAVMGIITGERIPEDGSLKDIYGSLPFGINSLDWVSVQVPETPKVSP